MIYCSRTKNYFIEKSRMTKREKSLSIVNYKGKRYSMSYVIGQMTM